MKKREPRKKRWTNWLVMKVIIVSFAKIVWNIVRIPYWLVKGVVHTVNKTSKRRAVLKAKREKEKISAEYMSLKVMQTEAGNFSEWEKKIISSDSAIGIIVGARGSGKTAFGLKWVENMRAKTGKNVYAMGFPKEEMPSWIEVVEEVGGISNDSIVLIDEGGILFSSRRAMSKPNQLLSQLLMISRHKNISIIFISQNSSNLEINILRQADYIVLKPSSLLQQEFERKIIQKLYIDAKKDFDKYASDKGIAYIYSSSFKGFISNPLPSFWSAGISKSFR